MAYTAPTGNALVFQSDGVVYAAPAGDAIAFDFAASSAGVASCALAISGYAAGVAGFAGAAERTLVVGAEGLGVVTPFGKTRVFLPLSASIAGAFPFIADAYAPLPLAVKAYGYVSSIGQGAGIVRLSGAAVGGGNPVFGAAGYSFALSALASGITQAPVRGNASATLRYSGAALGIASSLGAASAHIRLAASATGGRGARGSAVGKFLSARVLASRGCVASVQGRVRIGASGLAGHGVAGGAAAAMRYTGAAFGSLGAFGGASTAVRLFANARGEIHRLPAAPLPTLVVQAPHSAITVFTRV